MSAEDSVRLAEEYANDAYLRQAAIDEVDAYVQERVTRRTAAQAQPAPVKSLKPARNWTAADEEMYQVCQMWACYAAAGG